MASFILVSPHSTVAFQRLPWKDNGRHKSLGKRKESGGSTMDVRAAVAHQAGQPLTIETVQLEGPKEG